MIKYTLDMAMTIMYHTIRSFLLKTMKKEMIFLNLVLIVMRDY